MHQPNVLDLLQLLYRADNQQFWKTTGVRVTTPHDGRPMGMRAVLFNKVNGATVSEELSENELRHLIDQLSLAVPTKTCPWHGENTSVWATEHDCGCYAPLLLDLTAAHNKIVEETL